VLLVLLVLVLVLVLVLMLMLVLVLVLMLVLMLVTPHTSNGSTLCTVSQAAGLEHGPLGRHRQDCHDCVFGIAE
jgi:hypothetical protein